MLMLFYKVFRTLVTINNHADKAELLVITIMAARMCFTTLRPDVSGLVWLLMNPGSGL